MAVYDYINSSGTIIPDTAEIKTAVESEWREVFGDDFYIAPDTPEGVLITNEVTSRQSVARNNAALAGQINPNQAGGTFLDALWALTGGERRPAEHTIVTATLAGVTGTVVPAGSLAKTAAGDEFESLAGVIIEAGGIAVNFRSVEAGAIPCAIGALNQVVSGVLGWETVTNAAAGVAGRPLESDIASRNRRKVTLALQGRSTAEAIISQVMDVPGVRSMQFRENTASGTTTVDGISMAGKSIWACVDGGVDADIAAAMHDAKPAGAAYNGAVTVNVTDPYSGQVSVVRFARPTAVPVLVRITIKATSIISDPVSAVKSAVLAYAAGEDDQQTGFSVGGDVSPFELAGATQRAQPGLFVTLAEVAPVSTGIYSTATLDIDIDEKATINDAGISVVII